VASGSNYSGRSSTSLGTSLWQCLIPLVNS
jgi:hypothetical protein